MKRRSARRSRKGSAASIVATISPSRSRSDDDGLPCIPRRHELQPLASGDLRPALLRAALEQESIGQAPAVFVITAIYSRTTRKYGRRGAERYVHMEAGHVAQNLLLQATALGLGGVVIGAFEDEAVKNILGLPEAETPLYLIPVGYPRP